MAIVRYKPDQKKPATMTAAQWAKFDSLKDADIDYSGIPDLSGALAHATALPQKRQLTIRLDDDVLSWLKATGKGYQTRINRILRAAMESMPPPSRAKHARSK